MKPLCVNELNYKSLTEGETVFYVTRKCKQSIQRICYLFLILSLWVHLEIVIVFYPVVINSPYTLSAVFLWEIFI